MIPPRDLDRIGDVPRIPRIECELPPHNDAEIGWAILLAFLAAALIFVGFLHRHDRLETREEVTWYYGESIGHIEMMGGHHD